MKLSYILYSDNYRYSKKVKHLFEHAFPSEERPPFSWLVKMDRNQLFGVEDNDEFIGLLSLVEYQDLVYVFFLAVKKKYRGKGYGSKILRYVLEKYQGKRIFLLAEDPNIPCLNKEERKNRLKFYSHNGFSQTNLVIVEYEVQYVVLTNGCDVKKEDFLSVMEYLLNDYYQIYKENVF